MGGIPVKEKRLMSAKLALMETPLYKTAKRMRMKELIAKRNSHSPLTGRQQMILINSVSGSRRIKTRRQMIVARKNND